MKAYRDSKGYREIPVGYSAADIASLRPNLQNYLACGTNSSESLDFFALNAYEWCGESSYTTSGYSELNAMVTDYNIPIFFSEVSKSSCRPVVKALSNISIRLAATIPHRVLLTTRPLFWVPIWTRPGVALSFMSGLRRPTIMV